MLSAGMMFLPTSVNLQSAVAAPSTQAAPEDEVKGTVTDGKEPLIGAAVRVKGTQIGCTTDLNGQFTLKCKPGDVLEISFLGFKTVEKKATKSMRIVLQEDDKVMSDVVVTALGIKRDRKALGYGVSEVKGEELTKAKETNVINSLSGKVAGLVVQNTAGGASGSTRVLLRGNTEMTGDNQPLYVIDGVPMDNQSFGSASEGGGYDLGDPISAINPDDIETMTVLKGPAASALYGSRASHGVILITTKKAEKGKFNIEYNGSFTMDTQLAKWDNIQQVYGMGDNGQYQLDAASGTNQSWGVKADYIDKTYWDGTTRQFLMQPNNASGFFRTGLTAQNTAIASFNYKKTGVRFSVTDMRNKDILPNTNMHRDNFNLRVNTSAGPVDFDFTANYVNEGVKNRPALGDSQTNVGKNLMTLSGTYNQAWLQKYENEDGTYANWNGLDQYNKNPYWDLYKCDNTTSKDVFRFNGKVIYNITSHLKVRGTVGADITNVNFSDFTAYSTPGVQAGKLVEKTFRNRTINSELLGLYNNSWGDFDFNGSLGMNIYYVNNKTNIFTGTDQIEKNIINSSNYNEQSTQDEMYRKQINSIYGSASLGYLHTYYLEGTLRYDHSSSLPTTQNRYVYPSVSGSWVFSEYLKNKSIISYGKVRASWAKVGNDTDPYQLALNYKNSIYSYNNQNGSYIIGYINNSQKPNRDLKPTMTSSYELGLEMKFFNGRLGLDFTYYDQQSKNQIITLATSEASAYGTSLINAGNIQNRGIEVALNGRVLQIGDFAWDMGINFSKNSNKVLELDGDKEYLELANAYWANVSVGAEVGKNFGSIRGKDFARTQNGTVLIDPNTGMPLYDDKIKTLGDASWDWTGGGYLTFTYKNFRLSAGFDVKVGADIFSMSMRSAYLTGKANETLAGRDGWYASEEARKAAGVSESNWTPTGGYVASGVYAAVDKDGNLLLDENGNYVATDTQNSTYVNPQNYWKSVAEKAPGLFVYDNSYVKCREITFGYTFPKSMLGKYISDLNVSFVARNPFIIWKNIPNIDPDSGYNTSGLGLEYGSLPSRRSFGINVNLKF